MTLPKAKTIISNQCMHLTGAAMSNIYRLLICFLYCVPVSFILTGCMQPVIKEPEVHSAQSHYDRCVNSHGNYSKATAEGKYIIEHDCKREANETRDNELTSLQVAQQINRDTEARNKQRADIQSKNIQEASVAAAEQAAIYQQIHASQINKSPTVAPQAPMRSSTGATARPLQYNPNANPDYSDRQRVIASAGEPATECLTLSPGGYGGFKNSCGYRVNYGYCVYRPKAGGWTDANTYNCESKENRTPHSDGQTVGAFSTDANHTHGGATVFWIGCKDPAAPEQVYFNGSNIVGICRLR